MCAPPATGFETPSQSDHRSIAHRQVARGDDVGARTSQHDYALRISH